MSDAPLYPVSQRNKFAFIIGEINRGEIYSSVAPVYGISMTDTTVSTYSVHETEKCIVKPGKDNLSSVIHHSDRGTQYTSADYIETLHQYKMRVSMTESGNPKDNPEAERINNTLKNELFKDMVFHSVDDVKEAMKTAVLFYNHERPHRSIEMLTPMQASRRTGRFKRGWKSYRERAIDKAGAEAGQ